MLIQFADNDLRDQSAFHFSLKILSRFQNEFYSRKHRERRTNPWFHCRATVIDVAVVRRGLKGLLTAFLFPVESWQWTSSANWLVRELNSLDSGITLLSLTAQYSTAYIG